MSSNFSDFSQGSQGFDPYRSPVQGKKKGGSKTGWIVGIIVGVVLLVIVAPVVCCLGGGWLAWMFASNVIADALKQEVGDEPVVREHLGEIQKCVLNASKSSAAGGNDTYVFDVEGTKGKGEIMAQFDQSAQQQGRPAVLWARLRLSNGQEYPIIENQGPMMPRFP
jgi:hypothetical protein